MSPRPTRPVLDSARFGRTHILFLLGLAACCLIAIVALALVVVQRARAGVPGHGVGVDVGDQREAKADHGPVDHAVLDAVDLGAARGEQGEQDQPDERLRDEGAADRGAQ